VNQAELACGLILASSSPRRLDLLAQIGIVPSAIMPAGIDESPAPRELPRPHAQRLAREKVLRVAQSGAYTLAADTVVAVGRRILPKADDIDQARKCLTLLSGRRHHVFTAIALVAPDGKLTSRCVDSAVIFARLTSAQIEDYLVSGEWRGLAGGYGIQGRAASFVRSLSGSYSGVVGLPLHETANLLRGAGFLRP